MIPFLNVLLDDEEVDVWRKTLDLFGKLANHGEYQLKNHRGTTHSDYEAEFREAIASMTP
jgi:hypothetical protein